MDAQNDFDHHGDEEEEPEDTVQIQTPQDLFKQVYDIGHMQEQVGDLHVHDHTKQCKPQIPCGDNCVHCELENMVGLCLLPINHLDPHQCARCGRVCDDGDVSIKTQERGENSITPRPSGSSTAKQCPSPCECFEAVKTMWNML